MRAATLLCSFVLCGLRDCARAGRSIEFRLFPLDREHTSVIVVGGLEGPSAQHVIECVNADGVTFPIQLDVLAADKRSIISSMWYVYGRAAFALVTFNSCVTHDRLCSARRGLECEVMFAIRNRLSVELETLLHGCRCSLAAPAGSVDAYNEATHADGNALLLPAPLQPRPAHDIHPAYTAVPTFDAQSSVPGQHDLPERTRANTGVARAYVSAESLAWVPELIASSRGVVDGDVNQHDLVIDSFADWKRSFGGIPHLLDRHNIADGVSGEPESLARQLLTSDGAAELVAATMASSQPAYSTVSGTDTSFRTRRAARSAAVRALAERWGDVLTYARSPHGRLKSVAERLLLRHNASTVAPPAASPRDPSVERVAVLLETIAGVFDEARKRGISNDDRISGPRASAGEALPGRVSSHGAAQTPVAAVTELADLDSLLVELAEASREMPQPRKSIKLAGTSASRRQYSLIAGQPATASASTSGERHGPVFSGHARMTRWSEVRQLVKCILRSAYPSGLTP